MNPSPIPRVLSTFRESGVRALLMGGQACILYGAAEFSRDADFAVLLSPENLERLRAALDALHAEVIAVPPFERKHFERGHAVHFRSHHTDAQGFRIDVMSTLRGGGALPTALGASNRLRSRRRGPSGRALATGPRRLQEDAAGQGLADDSSAARGELRAGRARAATRADRVLAPRASNPGVACRLRGVLFRAGEAPRRAAPCDGGGGERGPHRRSHCARL